MAVDLSLGYTIFSGTFVLAVVLVAFAGGAEVYAAVLTGAAFCLASVGLATEELVGFATSTPFGFATAAPVGFTTAVPALAAVEALAPAGPAVRPVTLMFYID